MTWKKHPDKRGVFCWVIWYNRSMKNTYKKGLSYEAPRERSRGFTLVEMLLVIAIIGILATIVGLAVSSARAKARDVQRVDAVKTIQTALMSFKIDQGRYPTEAEFASGSLIVTSTRGTTTYLVKIPSAPRVNDGVACASSTFNYIPATDGRTYLLGYCLGAELDNLASGWHCANPDGMDHGGTCGNFICGVSTVAYDGGPYDSSGLVRNDGGYYRTVKICSPSDPSDCQCWLRDNLNAGEMLLSLNTVPSNDTNIEKHCYENNSTNCLEYGGLYDWYEAMGLPHSCYHVDGNNDVNCDNPGAPQYASCCPQTLITRGICPSGWHMPNDDEFQKLADNYLGGIQTCGEKIREAGTNHWLAGNCEDTDINCNSSGFTAVGAGMAWYTYWYGGLNSTVRFWTSSIGQTYSSDNFYTGYNSIQFIPGPSGREADISARCIKD